MRARRSKILLKSIEPTGSNALESIHEAEVAIVARKNPFQDPEHYIAHFEPGNIAQERGYDVNQPTNSFAEASQRAVMNLADDGTSFAPARPKHRWDTKKKNFVNRSNDDDGSGKSGKMIKGESGVKIPASMKSGRYPPPEEGPADGTGLKFGRMRIRPIYCNRKPLKCNRIHLVQGVDGSRIPRKRPQRLQTALGTIITCRRRRLPRRRSRGKRVDNYVQWSRSRS